MSQTDLIIHDEKDNVAVVVNVKTDNDRLTCAEALGHREFIITKLYRSA
jgi:(2R)-sulfolactate sulfo-lyase subunit beta